MPHNSLNIWHFTSKIFDFFLNGASTLEITQCSTYFDFDFTKNLSDQEWEKTREDPKETWQSFMQKKRQSSSSSSGSDDDDDGAGNGGRARQRVAEKHQRRFDSETCNRSAITSVWLKNHRLLFILFKIPISIYKLPLNGTFCETFINFATLLLITSAERKITFNFAGRKITKLITSIPILKLDTPLLLQHRKASPTGHSPVFALDRSGIPKSLLCRSSAKVVHIIDVVSVF